MLSKKLSRNLTGNNPKLKVDLAEIFDRFPKENNDGLKQAIGGAIIDRIRARAEGGNFIEQSPGAGRYSDEYVNSFEFKVFGKSRGNVNLTGTGDMLRSMDITRETDDTLEIGFNDRESAAKAHGHITGKVGKTRDFFGLTDSDISDIRREFKDEVKEGFASQAQGGSITEGQSRRPGESLIVYLRRILRERGES